MSHFAYLLLPHPSALAFRFKQCIDKKIFLPWEFRFTQPNDKELGVHDRTRSGGVIIKPIIRIKWLAFRLHLGSFGKVGRRFLKTVFAWDRNPLEIWHVLWRSLQGSPGSYCRPWLGTWDDPCCSSWERVAAWDFFGLGRYKMVNQWFIWNCSSTVWWKYVFS